MIRFNKLEFAILCFLILLCPSVASAQERSDSEQLQITEDMAPTADTPVLLKGAIQRVSKLSSKSKMERLHAEDGNSLSNQPTGQIDTSDGKQFLKFPKGSKRNLVSASAKLFTTKHGSFSKISFGDIERYQQAMVPKP